MKILSAIVLTAILLTLPGSSVLAETALFGATAYSGYPTFSITSVAQGTSVTISGSNFSPNDTYEVRMNTMYTQGLNGELVETVTTDASGNLSDTTYNIPSALSGDYKVAIRLSSPVNGYYAYNWFYNNTSAGANTGGPVSSSTYSSYPTFSISAVQRDSTVTISPSNFRANDQYNVRMNAMYTQGINGTVVQTVTTDASGTLSATTFSIPDALKGSYQIAVRVESVNAPYYYAYNWFYNNNAP